MVDGRRRGRQDVEEMARRPGGGGEAGMWRSREGGLGRASDCVASRVGDSWERRESEMAGEARSSSPSLPAEGEEDEKRRVVEPGWLRGGSRKNEVGGGGFCSITSSAAGFPIL
ncbi:unnamed protein product [Linum trigynum]|uniref:Uncharacterized protein n=1 Tax=Linum trigynum TaxID=586398 RepID=A0AAV2FTY2_9ROSI